MDDRRGIHATVLLLFTLLIGLGQAATAWSQGQHEPPVTPSKLRGQVRVAGSEGVIQGVMVRLEAENGGIAQQTSTDGLGQFEFSNMDQSIYYVVARAPGFREARQRVDLSTSPRSYVVLYLRRLPDEEETVRTSKPATVSVRVYQIPDKALKEIEKARIDIVEKNRFNSGIRHLKKAIALYPSLPDAYLLLGTAYMDLHKLTQAKKALKRAIELNKKMATAYFALGECYNQEHKYSEAESVLLKGLKLDEHSWQGHFSLGKTYWAMGDIARAAPQAIRAHELNPDFPQVHLLMGNIFLRQRRPRRALAEFEDYLKQAPDGPFAQQTRAVVKRIRRALAAPDK